MTKCPFCAGEISRRDLLPYFEAFDANNNNFLEKIIGDYPGIFMSHNRSDGKFKDYWNSRFGTTMNGSRGTVVNVTSSALSQNFNRNGNTYTISDNITLISSLDPSQAEIRISGVGSYKPKALVCSHCENFFPLDYLSETKDCFHIFLAGSSTVGKTAFAFSLMQNNFANLIGNFASNTLGLRVNINSASKCSERTASFLNELFYFETQGKLPENTKIPLPPLFLDFQWVKDGIHYEHTLCLIDTEGERWQTIVNGKQKDVVAEFIAPCLSASDGVFYFVEPSQSCRANAGSQPAIDYSSAQFRSSSDGAEIVALSADHDPKASQEKDASSAAAEAYDAVFRYGNFSNLLCAFILTKTDRFLPGGKYAGALQTDKIPYWNKLLAGYPNDGYDRPSKRRALYDTNSAPYKNIAAYKLFRMCFPGLPAVNNCTFRKCRWFAVSAFYGEPKNTYVDHAARELCLNIHEPLIWMLSELVRDKFTEHNIPDTDDDDDR